MPSKRKINEAKKAKKRGWEKEKSAMQARTKRTKIST